MVIVFGSSYIPSMPLLHGGDSTEGLQNSTVAIHGLEGNPNPMQVCFYSISKNVGFRSYASLHFLRFRVWGFRV